MNEKPLKLAFIRHGLTRWERIKVKWNTIRLALIEPAPLSWTEEVLLAPGEDGYEDAPFMMHDDPNPLRFDDEMSIIGE